MRFLCLCLLASGPLCAQFTRPVAQASAIDGQLWYEITVGIPPYENFSVAEFLPYAPPLSFADPTPVTAITFASPYSAVYPVVAPFYNYFSGGTAGYIPMFHTQAAAVRPELSSVAPAAPPHPKMIFLDGQGEGLVALDMTTLKTISQTNVPSMTGPFGLRPTSAGPPTEVWVLNNGNETGAGAAISVVNLTSQAVAASISIPSLPPTAFAQPVGIVFTNDGATAIEAFKYDTPDSSGNNGALVVFDAAGRTVTSTTPLKTAPTWILMAPDGLTAYILNSSGVIDYYDVLSGTADLSAATVLPGSEFGYPGIGAAVAIHPDGTRIFWNVGVYLVVFDLTTRQITNTFNCGLSTSIPRTFSLSPDGEMAYFSNTAGDVAVVDTTSGTILTSYNATGAGTSVYGGPPVAP